MSSAIYKQEVKKLNDFWLRVIGVPIVALQFTGILNMWEPQMQTVHFLNFFLVNSMIVLISWQLCRPVLVWSRLKYKGIDLFLKRFVIAYGIYFCIVLCVFIFFFFVCNATNYYGYKVSPTILIKYQLISMFNVPFVAIIYEARLFFSEWKKTLVVKEELKRETLQNQLDNVKGQINPNFLFSNLHTLTLLIRNKNKSATKFVDELSQVYRYVLQGTEKQLTELCDELKFVSTYEYLLKEKYGDAVQFDVNVPDHFHKLRIPMLTMQILIENALKREDINADQPLRLKFASSENQSLMVSYNFIKNNNQKLKEEVLNNIKERYQMLGTDGVTIERTDKECKVILPLLN